MIVLLVLLAAVASNERIVSPVKIDSIGAIVRAVTALEGIAPHDRAPQALNASVVSARMAAVVLVAPTGIAMRPEAASINPPSRGRNWLIPLMLRPMTCSGGATPPRQLSRPAGRFIAFGAHQSYAALPNFSSC